MKRRIFSTAFCLVVSIVGFYAEARAELIYGMTAASSASTAPGIALVSFDSATPGTVTTIGNFTGLVAGHALRSIDFRPANAQLYAISTSTTNLAAAQLYTVNLTTAALTPLGAGFTLGTNNNARVEMDFNPSVDRIRIITGAASTVNNNFRANPNDGTLVQADTNLIIDAMDPNSPYTGFTMVAAAYSNNTPAAPSTTLYAYDFATDVIFRVGSVGGTPTSPNTGIFFTSTLIPAGFLTFNGGMGMDISGATGNFYMAHDNPADGTTTGLYTRALSGAGSDADTLIGSFPTGTFVVDISVRPLVTAAEVTVSGRVIAQGEGRGLRGAVVSLRDQSGNVRTTLTGFNGAYRFDGVEAGQTYIVSVRARRYSYAPRIIDLQDSLTDVDFYPEQ